jgi:pimeloyl-ACP methyl ester carboxylesterase
VIRAALVALTLIASTLSATPALAASKQFCVFNIRGYFGFMLSRGLPTLTATMRAQGIEAYTYDHGFLLRGTFAPYIAGHAIHAYKSGCNIVLVGHSFGGDTAAKVAEILKANGVQVTLLVAIDPTNLHSPPGGPFVPSSVRDAMGFYQLIGPIGRGILRRGPGYKGPLVLERRDQVHTWMDNDPVIHSKIISRIKRKRTNGK